jgi:hypothetical protein
MAASVICAFYFILLCDDLFDCIFFKSFKYVVNNSFRGESVATIKSVILSPTQSVLNIILLDNMDELFQELSDPLTAVSLASTLLEALDVMRKNTTYKGFMVATCTDMSRLADRLFRLARFGDPLRVMFPSMCARTGVVRQALRALSKPVLEQLLSLVERSVLNTIRLDKENNTPSLIKNKRDDLCEILATEIARRTQVNKTCTE